MSSAVFTGGHPPHPALLAHICRGRTGLFICPCHAFRGRGVLPGHPYLPCFSSLSSHPFPPPDGSKKTRKSPPWNACLCLRASKRLGKLLFCVRVRRLRFTSVPIRAKRGESHRLCSNSREPLEGFRGMLGQKAA